MANKETLSSLAPGDGQIRDLGNEFATTPLFIWEFPRTGGGNPSLSLNRSLVCIIAMGTSSKTVVKDILFKLIVKVPVAGSRLTCDQTCFFLFLERRGKKYA